MAARAGAAAFLRASTRSWRSVPLPFPRGSPSASVSSSTISRIIRWGSMRWRRLSSWLLTLDKGAVFAPIPLITNPGPSAPQWAESARSPIGCRADSVAPQDARQSASTPRLLQSHTVNRVISLSFNLGGALQAWQHLLRERFSSHVRIGNLIVAEKIWEDSESIQNRDCLLLGELFVDKEPGQALRRGISRLLDLTDDGIPTKSIRNPSTKLLRKQRVEELLVEIDNLIVN